MSFSAGTFSINSSGQPVVSGTTISASVFNALTADLATGLSTCMLKDGTQTATAGIGFFAGTVSLPGIYFGTDTATGLYRIGLNNTGYSINGTKLLDLSAALFAVTGAATVSTTLGVTGITTLGAAIVGPASATVFNTVSTTVNAFGSATTLNMGNAGGTNTILGASTFSQATTLSAALTYGGVTLSNAVTGTGNMVLSASPTLTGTLTADDISIVTLAVGVGVPTTKAEIYDASTGALLTINSGTNNSARGILWRNGTNSTNYGSITSDYTSGVMTYDSGIGAYAGTHVFKTGSGTTVATLSSTGLAITGTLGVTSYIQGTEESAPSAPAANGYRIFAQDNGAGKTQLMVIFSSGAAQQLALHP